MVQRSAYRRRRRARPVPWAAIALFANAGMTVGLWLGRRVRWVRHRHLLLWTAGVAAATGTYAVATLARERTNLLGPAARQAIRAGSPPK